MTYINGLFKKNKLDKGAMRKLGKKLKVKASRDCYGHLFAEYCYRILSYITNKHKIPTIAKHHVNCLAIDKFIIHHSSVKSGLLYRHYKKHFTSLPC